MLWSNRDLYEGFISETMDAEIGTKAIEYWLNSAYQKVIEQKLSSFDALWTSREARKAAIGSSVELSQKPGDPGGITNIAQLIHKFGSLVSYCEYGNIPIYFTGTEVLRINAAKAGHQYFLITEDSQSESWYIPKPATASNPTDKPTKMGTRTRAGTVGADPQTVTKSIPRRILFLEQGSKPLRPLPIQDEGKYRYMYDNNDDLIKLYGYRYYIITTKKYKVNLTDTDWKVGWFVELYGDDTYPLTGYVLLEPTRITLDDPDPFQEKVPKYIEVEFGDEIVSAAVVGYYNSLKNNNK